MTLQAAGCTAHIIKITIENNHWYMMAKIINHGLLKGSYDYEYKELK
jgi:hypothetical protein